MGWICLLEHLLENLPERARMGGDWLVMMHSCVALVVSFLLYAYFPARQVGILGDIQRRGLASNGFTSCSWD
jgi:hypothetical protein